MELGSLKEMKEKYEDKNKTLSILFKRGYINEHGLQIKEHEE